ncbi:MAG: transcription-repair coupling factor [SAR324 cluster bacterium]|nr:transcription-repair coupling factor [SAR324 cluster bacterium]
MHELFASVLEKLTKPAHDLYFSSLQGSSKSFLISYLQQVNVPPIVVVTYSFEKAEQLRDDLSFFSKTNDIYFFPHWDTLPYDNFSPHRDVVAQRFITLKALCDHQAKILITTPTALMQRMIPKPLFEQNSFVLQQGQTYHRNDLIEQCKEAGYTLVDMIEERGEYSIREEIIDLFPLNLETPVRLEWDGECLAQIKEFDVQTQLADGDPHDALEVLPGQEVLLTYHTLQCASTRLKQTVGTDKTGLYHQTNALLEQGTHFPGIESILGLFYENPHSLFNYIDSKSLFVLDEPSRIEEKARLVYDEIFSEFELSQEQDNFALNPELLYLSHQDIHRLFKKFLTIHCFESTHNPPGAYPAPICPFLANHFLRIVEKQAHHPPHSSIANIINTVKNWQQEGAVVVFTAKNQTHGDHLKELLADFMIEASPAALENQGFTNWPDWITDHLATSESTNTSSVSPIAVGPLSEGFHVVNEEGRICFALLTEEEIFGEKIRKRRLKQHKMQQLIGNLDDLEEGDYIVHLDYGIGKYQGLEKIEVQGTTNDFMVLTYARDEKVYVPVDKFHLVQKYINSDGSPPRLNKLGEKSWKKAKNRVAKAVEDMSQELIEIYAARQAKKGFRYSPDNHLMTEFELAFPYEETEDQLTVIDSVKKDMESFNPMDRLVCGDVGFGKTEIAIRAAFKTVLDSRQVCVLVPTTILAQQHLVSFQNRMEEMPVVVDLISRFRTPSEQRKTIKRLESGEIDILIGTHRVLSTDVKFKNLGLLVVDEEQRFGVRHKEKIKKFRAEIDVLTLSATPIPRTLHMSMLGIRDLSIINSPPPDRLAIRTRFLKSSAHIIQEAVSREIRRNGQVFIVHNRVDTIFEYAAYLKQVLPQVRIAVGHGQMGEHELENVMMNFINGEYDVLVSTTIIESGLDIPRANTIIVNNAHQMGLSQLYQLRGRVGRSNLQAYAYLLVPPDKILTTVAEERLKILQELNALGGGFKIATRDLELRGAGNLLGSEQSGHIASVGMELYTQMIEDAVKKIQQKQKELLEPSEIKINFQIPTGIPEEYVPSSNQRLSLYKRLAAVQTEEELWKLRDDTENRYGHLPESLINLFKCGQARLLGQRYGLKTIEHRKQELRIEIAHGEKLNTQELVAWLQDQQKTLRFIPENTLMLEHVPNSMDKILENLRGFEKLFIPN